MAKVFVGGLSWDTTDESLKKAFEPFGTLVSANIISDRETGTFILNFYVQEDLEDLDSSCLKMKKVLLKL